MNLRRVFKELSEQLLSEFRKTAEVAHPGGRGALREDALKEFLRTHLPSRYGVGQGEIISAENYISGQLDVVIHDPSHCPLFLKSSSHSIYPIESVYGVVSVKSDLSSENLRDAYANIRTAKELVGAGGFTHKFIGIETTFARPEIVGVVFAYRASRSLEAISKQVALLDQDLPAVKLRPDFVVVLGEGIIGPRGKLRGDFNSITWPGDEEALTSVRKTKRYTLMRFYLQLLQEINSMVLPELDLNRYLRMPELIDGHRVRRHNRLVRSGEGGRITSEVRKLSAKAIRKIVEHCEENGPVTQRQNLLNTVGMIPVGMSERELAALVYEYNPNGLPPLDISKLRTVDGRPMFEGASFRAMPLEIDEKHYAIDVTALDEDDFQIDSDHDLDELLEE